MSKNQRDPTTSLSDPMLRGQPLQTATAVNNSGPLSVPSISLPKGGGAIRGIGEKFAANPVTGTGSLTVPIATSPGRGGFGPQLSLSYDSGTGNGPFGFGWHLSLPAITRKTDKGVPQYRDGEESDVFILSGAEDLVPVLQPNGSRFADITTAPGFIIHRYRPRIEGLFARIERWTNQATGEMHWRSISRENVTTLYGKTANARISDPDDSLLKTFSWLICESYDDKGNAIVYEYVDENGSNIDVGLLSERNRIRSANRYVKHIRYGNTISRLVQPDLTKTKWLFDVCFDYDEEHYRDLPLDVNRPGDAQHRFVSAAGDPGRLWLNRPDPFSSYRAGFEARVHRRCRRVLMFHLFAELGAEPYLVRATEFDYADLNYSLPTTIDAELSYQGSTRTASWITAVNQYGFVRDDTQAMVTNNGVNYFTYLRQALPPLEFEYSKAIIDEQIHELDSESLENLPIGLDARIYQWIDLDGEGISGVLAEQADSWVYKPNLGDGHFGALKTIASTPSLAQWGAQHQFLDLAGDGQLDVASFVGPMPGFYERGEGENWETLTTFASLPNLAWDDPNLRFVDLSGDGHADVLITEDEVFSWHESLAEAGFGPVQYVRQSFDEEKGPRVVFADGTESIYLADMSGDNLTDIVRVRNGEICYWPNLGYGRFGAKVTMDNSPWFDEPEQFNQQRIRMADIDGSGTSDIIYVASDGLRLYFNQSGNRWSNGRPLTAFPPVENVSSVVTADLFGNGTACLIWSSPLPRDRELPLRYVDLMSGQKPHLLIKSANNLGAETHVHYTASTKFYLADKRAGKPWITRVPFPVHVVERVDTYDRISGNRFVTRYSYHHGYFDGVEREFRGFGRVDQIDTEEFAALSANQQFPSATNVERASHVPPVLTRTWFHNGVFLNREHISDYFAGFLDNRDRGEYYREPGLTGAQARPLLLTDTELPGGLSVEEEREACRALKGSMLRQEVYALDAPDEPKHPYTVSEQNFTIELVQARETNRHAVFFVHAREAINYHYEREPNDPRVSHNLTLMVDEFGNVLRSAALGYGRRQPDPNLLPAEQATQSEMLITCAENDFTNAINDTDDYRSPLTSEARTYQLTGLSLSPGQSRFSFAEVLTAGAAAVSIDYEQTPNTNNLQKRLLECVRTLYRRDDLTAPLPLGQLQPRALRFESYRLAFTPGLIANVYGGRVVNAMLAGEGGYVHVANDANWWIPSGQIFYSSGFGDSAGVEFGQAQAHFFLARRYRDPFHTAQVNTETSITYDDHDLLIREIRDAVGNRITAGERNANPAQPLVTEGNDYRVLQPFLIMDANRNRAMVAFDALGMVSGTAVMGKPEDAPAVGDQLAGSFKSNLTQDEITQFLSNPKGATAATLLDLSTSRTVYDLQRYRRTLSQPRPSPAYAATLHRETHNSEPTPTGGLRIQVSFSYLDGFGREIQKKGQAEAGRVPTRDAKGRIIIGVDNQPVMTAADVTPRWVGSGWTVFNNKGKPVRQYEPFFTDTHEFEFDVRAGVSPLIFYDPVGRVVATLHPNHTWEKVVFDSWRQETWDVNDTVLVVDPKNDTDVGDFFRRLQSAEYLPTWHGQRQGGAMGPAEQDAANKAALHAGTPSQTYFDSLGRTFLTIVQNRYNYSNAPAATAPTVESYSTRSTLDIEGNQREVVDALGRVVMRYDYDMLSNRIHETSMESGERWILNDVTGKRIRSWDSRGYVFQTAYDARRRPVASVVHGGNALDANSEFFAQSVVFEETIYGDSAQTGLTEQQQQQANLRGQVWQQRDGAGVITNDRYDFKGNSLGSVRQVSVNYWSTLDWSQTPNLDPQQFISSSVYDALNRSTELATPDNSIIRRTFNDGNLLERVEVNLRGVQQNGVPVFTTFVNNIDYNAKGQRLLIEYGSGLNANGPGVISKYEYDPETFRLVRLQSLRDASVFPNDCPQPVSASWPGCQMQDLNYTYDPAGNITNLRDDAQQAIFFRNKRVEPSAAYTYDAAYRLIEATGREHLGQVGGAPVPHSYNDKPRVGIKFSANDGTAMGLYLERYSYDPVGNFKEMVHQGKDPVQPGWTRTYTYSEASLIEPLGTKSNRLSATNIGSDTNTYSTLGNGYDAHGNMLRMPQLQVLRWDFKDQLQMTRRQAVNATAEETQHAGEQTWYVYDSAGQRVRKITETSTGQVKDERIYVGGFEIYRRSGTNAVERETLHIMDDKQRVALVETRTQGNEPGVPIQLIRYQFGNHLGSASLELDQQAQIISYEEYTPYGSTSLQAGETETPKRYRYTGQERDEESGFNYHSARYYATWLGRWVSCDPLGIADGTNLWQYVRCNPIRGQDRTGTQTTVEQLFGDFTQTIGDSRNPIATVHSFSEGEEVTGYIAPTHAEAAVLRARQEGRQLNNLEAKVLAHSVSPGFLAQLRKAENQQKPVAHQTFNKVDVDALKGIDVALKLQLSVAAQVALGAGVLELFGKTGTAAGIGLKTYSAQKNARVAITGKDDDRTAGTFERVIAAGSALWDVFGIRADVKALNSRNPLIAPYDKQPKPRIPAGTSAHHPESKADLGKAPIEGYDLQKDPTVLLPVAKHGQTFQPQAWMRQDPTYIDRLGSADHIAKAAVNIHLSGESATLAAESALDHADYLFGLTPLSKVYEILKSHK